MKITVSVFIFVAAISTAYADDDKSLPCGKTIEECNAAFLSVKENNDLEGIAYAEVKKQRDQAESQANDSHVQIHLLQQQLDQLKGKPVSGKLDTAASYTAGQRDEAISVANDEYIHIELLGKKIQQLSEKLGNAR